MNTDKININNTYTNKMNTNNTNDWFTNMDKININDLQYIPDPEPMADLRVTRSDKHVDDYIEPLKKPKEEEDPLAKLELVDTHSNRIEPVDYESTYKTMDPFFEMLFKSLDDPLFKPTPKLEDLDRRLSEMYYNSIKNE